jgi:CubicO group peptidase (beta-lactamase class C family)
MSSGVDFGEAKDGQRDLDRLWVDMVLGMGPTHGTIASIVQFNRRIAAAGTRYFYASIEADVLGVVLQYAVNKPASDYLQEKIWEPIGAEADAAWVVDAQGFEVAHCCFNAVLRDYARLGRLFAHNGAWEGKQIIPAQWLIEATTVRPEDNISRAGQVHANVWLRLPLVAASRSAAPICARGSQGAAHLCRSLLETGHGPDGRRGYP